MDKDKPKLGWGHINVNVSNLDRSIAFYEKLGFELFIPSIPYLAMEKSPESSPIDSGSAEALGIAQGVNGRACIMQLSDGLPKLDLIELEDIEQRAPLKNADLGVVRICLASGNLKEDVDRLATQGVEFLSEPKTGHKELADIAVCMDPDGTLIELIQIHLDRWMPILTGGDV